MSDLGGRLHRRNPGGAMGEERRTVVIVWNKPYEVSVYRRSPSVWVAAGEYMGEMISVTGRTSNFALTLWTEAAKSAQ